MFQEGITLCRVRRRIKGKRVEDNRTAKQHIRQGCKDRDARIEVLQGELNDIKSLLWFRLFKFIFRR